MKTINLKYSWKSNTKDEKVEYSLAQTGVAGDKGKNFITTSHERGKESGMGYLFQNQLVYGYYIRELDHTHPASDMASESDISLKTKNNEDLLQNKKPKYHIYYVPNQEYIPF